MSMIKLREPQRFVFVVVPGLEQGGKWHRPHVEWSLKPLSNPHLLLPFHAAANETLGPGCIVEETFGVSGWQKGHVKLPILLPQTTDVHFLSRLPLLFSF